MTASRPPKSNKPNTADMTAAIPIAAIRIDATEIIVPEIKDFGEKYRARSTHARQQIFASFRAVPALFGIMTESTGFNEQEFAQAFKLYNRTMVRPVQRLICDTYDKIYGINGSVNIRPFSIEGTEQTVE